MLRNWHVDVGNGDGGKSWRVFKLMAVGNKPLLFSENGNNFTIHGTEISQIRNRLVTILGLRMIVKRPLEEGGWSSWS